MKYNFWKSLLKVLIRILLIAGPAVLAFLPKEWMNVTLGGVLGLLFDWAKKSTVLE